METVARGWRIALLITAAIGAVLLAVALLASAPDASRGRPSSLGALALGQALAPPRTAPRLALVDEHGQPTSLAAFHGRWLVLTPAMTLCHEVCPMTTGVLEQLTSRIGELGLAGRVAVAEISVDPWRDTPARLRAYRRMTGANFTLLTGSDRQLTALWKFFGVYFQRVPQSTPPDIDWLTARPERFDVQHTDGVFILDPQGRERVVDEGMAQVSGALPTSLRRLLNAEGRHNLTDPQSPWTAAQVLDDLDHLGLAGVGSVAAASKSRSADASGLHAAETVSEAAGASDPQHRPAAALGDSPPPLASLHAQAGALLGGEHALRARLRTLRGYPVVLNAWASWCPPCRAEFPLLAAAGESFGAQVAFLGADTDDSAGPARGFLADHHVAYPSYQVTAGGLEVLAPVPGTPATIFIDPSGAVVHVHDGQYESLAALDGDVARYALGS